MAGIGVKLNRIYARNSIAGNLYGALYSTVVTIAPMLVVFGAVMLMRYLLHLEEVGYAARELYSCTVLYMFIFSFLVVSPFNPVISRYMSDTIYEEQYEDILPCFYLGLFMTVVLGCTLGIPFCLHEHFTGEVPVYYVFTGFCGYIGLILAVYCMSFLSISKDYKRVSLFLIGMAAAVLVSLGIRRFGHMEQTYRLPFRAGSGVSGHCGSGICADQAVFSRKQRKISGSVPVFSEILATGLRQFFICIGPVYP